MSNVGTRRSLMRPTVARLRRASARQEDRRYASQSGPCNEPPFLQRSLGAGCRACDLSISRPWPPPLPFSLLFWFYGPLFWRPPSFSRLHFQQFPLSFCQRFRQSLSFFLRLSRQPP